MASTTFRPQPAEKNVEITISLPSSHHARLVEAGVEHQLSPEEVLRQFIGWAINTSTLSVPAKPKARKPKKGDGEPSAEHKAE